MEQEDISFSDFIASSIHDMKNSLSIQIGALEELLAESRQEGGVSACRKIEQMIYEANRMNGNLIQILSLYKLGKSIYPVDISDQPVKELIEEVVSQYQSIMDAKGISVEVACEENCYWYLDRDLVAGVLINALNNAYKYTSDKIQIAAKVNDGFLEISVADNGNGYPETFLQQDVAVNKGISFTSGSTGLGFYFSSRVAKLHKNGDVHGTLAVKNGGIYGGGCFMFKLP